MLLKVSGSRSILSCPKLCTCPLDKKGRRLVKCSKGGLIDPLPILDMPEDAEILIVEAPDEFPNSLTLGPIFKGHLKMEEIHVTNSGVPALGAHSFWGLRRLRILNVSHNIISALMATNFRGPELLKELDLSHNRIESVPSAVFRYVRQLRVLDLSNNKIPELVPRIFFGLSKLEQLHLSNNPLGELPYDRFSDIPALQDLRCASCGLLSITSNALQELKELTYLDLRDNRLTQIPAVSFVPKLTTLLLDGNHITVIGRGAVSWLPLRKLTLAHNRISKVEPGSFDNTSITTLNLSYNRITTLDTGALDTIIMKMRDLDLSGNSISVDQFRSILPKARQLRKLGLGDLGLTRLSPELLRHSRHLRILNVSSNYLSKFPHELLYSTPHLQHLDLSTNSFHGLHEELITAFKSTSSLVNIQLEGNPWICEDCHVNALIEWLKYNPSQPNTASACTGVRPSRQCLRCVGPNSLAGQEILLLNEEQLPVCRSSEIAGWPSWLGESNQPNRGAALGDDPRLPRGNPSMPEANKEDKESVAAFFKDHLALLVGVGCGLVLALLLVVVIAVALSRRHSAFYYTCESDSERREKLMGRNNNDSPVTRPASPDPSKVPEYSPMAISRVHAKTPIRAHTRTPTVTFSPQGTATIATIEEITSLDSGDGHFS